MTPNDPSAAHPMRPTITDQEVARLPLSAGRADLLEEIMATPRLDHADHRPRRTPPGWAVAAAAAAAVAAIVIVPNLGGDAGPAVEPRADDPPSQRIVGSREIQAAPAGPEVRGVTGGRYVGLEMAGWDVEALYEGFGQLTIGWSRGDQQLEINRIPDDLYQGYLADRMRIGPAQVTTVLGHEGTTWAYTRTDHATMTEPADGFYFEIRAGGMPLPKYRELLDTLVQTDEAGFYEGLPEGTVSPMNHDEAIRDLLREVPVPEGFGIDDVRLDGFASPYHAATAVAGSVGCAWLDVYAGGSPAQQKQALAAFDGSVDWPVLTGVDAEGDYPEVFWMIADDLRDGRTAAELRPGIC